MRASPIQGYLLKYIIRFRTQREGTGLHGAADGATKTENKPLIQEHLDIRRRLGEHWCLALLVK